MTKVRNCVLDALSINVNNIISLVVGTFPQDPTVSKTAVILTILTATQQAKRGRTPNKTTLR
ncbi:TPA: hypothetical protein JLH05_000859 [Escherichia coli]|nr:hypothetical protein [Escherichia coli]